MKNKRLHLLAALLVGARAFADADYLAFFEARNAVANAVLQPPPEGGAVPFHPVETQVRTACPACRETGELLLTEPDYGQNAGRIGGRAKTTRVRCPLCRGARGWRAYLDPARLAERAAQDRARFEDAHRGRGDVAAGGAFVPHAVYAALDPKQRKATLKLVEDAYGKPCSRCKWTGVEACRKCRGEGTVKCPNKDCKAGWQVTKTTTTTSSSGGGIRSNGGSGGFHHTARHRTTKRETVTVAVCPDCGGADRVLCPDCGGRRARPCAKCGGTGRKAK